LQRKAHIHIYIPHSRARLYTCIAHNPPQKKIRGSTRPPYLENQKKKETRGKLLRAYSRFTIPPMLPSYLRFRE